MELIVTLPSYQQNTLSPLANWMVTYVEQHQITLTELSRQAGLSDGALRSLLRYPTRVPTLETCLRLSHATGKPAEEIFHLAGLPKPKGSKLSHLHPDRLELVKIFEVLPHPLQTSLLEVARALQASLTPPDHK
jgi:transcriptional regulator with XRE-family HTH domain